MFTAEKKRLSETLPHYCVLDQIQERPHGELQLFPGMTIRDVPAHVCVFVTAHPEPESNIKIELWIPLENWNGDLAAIGNGGSAGSLPSFMLSTPLRLGFAAVTTDMGTSAGSDCGIGNKAVWKDFGYRATHIMAIIGKQL